MIKNAIIIILMSLLLITLYSYYCLSKKMIDYEKKRLEYIINKENELVAKESKINKIEDCNDKYLKCKNILDQIDNLIENSKDKDEDEEDEENKEDEEDDEDKDEDKDEEDEEDEKEKLDSSIPKSEGTVNAEKILQIEDNTKKI
jgi:ABC-type Zn2+ transport system substrate-binding protein/surface adhesin